MNERITLEDTTISALMKLSEGNPGALSVLARWLKEGSVIDPYADPFMGVLMLDTFGIYGPDIWILYKDICDSSLGLFWSVVRAMQYGIVPATTVKRGISEGRGQTVFSPTELRDEVRRELPNFDAAAQADAATTEPVTR